MMDPNHFLMIVLSRFELYHIFSSADCRKRYSRDNANKVFLPCHLLFSLLSLSQSISTEAVIHVANDACVCVCQDVVQQNNTLIEEMLHLVIMVVGKC